MAQPKYNFGEQPKYKFPNQGVVNSSPVTPEMIQQTQASFEAKKPQIKTEPKIDAPNIGTTPVNLPTQKPDTTDYNAIVAGAVASAPATSTTPSGAVVNNKTREIVSEPQAKEEAPTESKNLYETIKNQITGGTFFGEAPQRTDITGMQAQAGIPEKQQLVNDLTSQLNAINAEAEVGKLSTIGQGRGIPQAILGGQQAQLERERAIRALPIAAQLSAAQGNLQAAQGYVTQALDLEKDYQTRLTTYNNQRLEAVWEIATAEEKTRLEELRTKNDNEQAQFDRVSSLKESMIKTALGNGQPGLISQLMGATTENEVYSVASQLQSSVANLDTQVVTLGDGRTLLINKNTGDIIKDISSSSATPEAEATQNQKTIDQINFVKTTLKNAQDLADASGRSGARKMVEGLLVGETDYTNLVSNINTLQTNILTLMVDPGVKKFFGPQMTEKDVELMTATGTTLNAELQSPEAMRTELVRLEELMGRIEASVPNQPTKEQPQVYNSGGVDYELRSDGLYYPAETKQTTKTPATSALSNWKFKPLSFSSFFK